MKLGGYSISFNGIKKIEPVENTVGNFYDNLGGLTFSQMYGFNEQQTEDFRTMMKGNMKSNNPTTVGPEKLAVMGHHIHQ